MLSEFECQICGTKFVVAFTDVRPGFPVRYCVACGSDDLKCLGSKPDQEWGPQTQKLQSEIASMMERVFRNVWKEFSKEGKTAECQLLDAIAEEFHELTEAK